MPIKTATFTDMEPRVAVKKSRVFRRSRGGCRNCKLRKIKCDQAKPQCRCCLSFGVVCNYGISIPDLLPSKEAHSQWFGTTYDATPRAKAPIPPLKQRVSSQVASRTSSVVIELDAGSMRIITRFYEEIKARFEFPAKDVLQFTQSYPFLMHATLALSLAHDRSLTSASKPNQGRTVREMKHFLQCTTLFQRHLREGIHPIDRDPIWATASWLSILLFLAIDESDPSKAWPFKGSETADLDWLRMGDTKWKLYQLTNPDRPESIFYPISNLYSQMRTNISASGIATISPSLYEVCGLDGSSRQDTNPYFQAAQTVTNLKNFEPANIPMPAAMSFITHGHPDFKVLLLKKDPVALLLLALWYSRVRKSVWWINLRAMTELEAICLYLRKHYNHDALIMEHLPSDH
ncbi:unnamed protein product [Clonostachys rosea f. rosea IK726]|uniref:Zn(2)-C6 fungal-type domain-containing protein n=2 Tax=Bionectria ochroleuca TaxID=29856 RepID=A0A0B7K168_BIOOC|nr:unnamed protein product [Clonostachys rosea f. rosea IK726]